jgi:hypothetical protein
MAQNMHDGDLHIEYMCDLDAGGAIQDGTQWLDNSVMYLHLTEWEVTAEARTAYQVIEPTHWYHPPIKVPPGKGSVTLQFKVFSIGNANLIWDASSPDACVTGSGSGNLPPRDSATVTLSLSGDGGCSGTFIDAVVELNTNEEGGTTFELPVQGVVAEDYFECPKDPETVDTLYNGVLTLFVNANCGEAIRDSASYPDTGHDVFFEGGTIVATTIGSDTLTGRFFRDDRFAGARDKLYTAECSQDWEPDFWLVYTRDVFMHDFEPPADYNWYWWEMSKQIKFFKETAPEIYKRIVIKYIEVRRHDPPDWWPTQPAFTGYEDTYIGMLDDMDCPWDSVDNPNPDPNIGDENATNEGGYEAGAGDEFAWQRGYGNNEHPSYSGYYTGMALASGGSGDGTVPYGTYNVKNNVWVYPHGGWGWDSQELYDLASQTGNNIEFPESLVDRSQVFTAAQIPAGSDEDAKAKFTMILAVASGADAVSGLALLNETIDTARVIYARELAEGYPALCGDVNTDGSVGAGDVVYLISYLFRGGDPPPCPILRGDANLDNAVSAGDVVFLISYLFRGGPSPLCPGIWGP